jgi:Uncharacterised protein family (UPF0164)
VISFIRNALFLLILFALPARADFFVGKGGTSSTFLKIPVSGRSLALGNSFTAMNNDVTAIDYNPAGLTGLKRADINLTYINYFEGASLQSAALAYPVALGNTGPSTASRILDLGFEYRVFRAKDTARNEIGTEQGEFDVRDQLIQVSLGYALSERMAIGASGKVINSKLDDASSSNYAADVGLLCKVTPLLSLGFSLLNMGPDSTFETVKDPLPTTGRVGAALKLKSLTILADASSGRDKITVPSAGLELNMNPYLAFRGGVVADTHVEVTGGLGVRLSNPAKELKPTAREHKTNRKILDDLSVPQNSPVYKKNTEDPSLNSLDFGLDYAFRVHPLLGLSHTITLKVLY